MKINTSSLDNDLLIITKRVLNYSRKTVFSAWSNPEVLKNWWGPKGFTNTFEEFDFRPGGRWKFVMHGPDKGNYNNECEFIEIEEPKLIYWKRHSKPLFKILVTFEEIQEEKTKLIFRMIFPTKSECEKMKKYVINKNEENFDKLENVLSHLVSG